MKKNTIKAFTLVEMLIVIVIIGILIASLMPRMQAAQGRARDVARKNDLSQVQTAIISSQSDKGYWPGLSSRSDTTGSGTNGMSITGITQTLLDAGMSSVPHDPNGSNPVSGLGSGNLTVNGEYIYLIAKRNGTPNGGFALMASTEVEGSSNWVVCGSGATIGTGKGRITNSTDLANITLCSSVSKSSTGACVSNTENCTYSETSQLRYLLVY